MPIITTDKLGLTNADPKPVRGINWAGLPMKEGESYWGGSKPQEPQQENIGTSDTDIRPLTGRRKAKRNPKAWSPEARAAYSERMKAWWQAKKQQTKET